MFWYCTSWVWLNLLPFWNTWIKVGFQIQLKDLKNDWGVRHFVSKLSSSLTPPLLIGTEAMPVSALRNKLLVCSMIDRHAQKKPWRGISDRRNKKNILFRGMRGNFDIQKQTGNIGVKKRCILFEMQIRMIYSTLLYFWGIYAGKHVEQCKNLARNLNMPVWLKLNVF